MSEVWEVEKEDAFCSCGSMATRAMRGGHDRIKFMCVDCLMEWRLRKLIEIWEEMTTREELEDEPFVSGY